MKKIQILGIALLAVSVLATASVAQQGKAARGNHPQARQGQGQHYQGKMELGLSQDQKTQIQSIVKKFWEDVKGIRQSSANTDEKKAQVASLRESAAGSINSILTPEQQAKASKMGLIKKLLGPHPGMQERMEMFSKLNLTDAQKTQITAIMQSTREKVKAVKQDSTLSDDAKKTQITALRKDSRQQILALLTPEQQQQLKEMRKQCPRGQKEK